MPGSAKKTGVNIHLYSDDNPATTTKGTGFRDRETALRTIRLTEANKPPNKRIWTINTMFYRAKHHPNQTQGMREAMEVFESWIKDYKDKKAREKSEKKNQKKTKKRGTRRKRDLEDEGKKVHEKRVKSRCNADSLANVGDVAEFRKRTRENMQAARAAVRKGLCMMGHGVKLTPQAFTALFGSAGTHGYGSHKHEGSEHVVQIEGKDEMDRIFTKTLNKGRGSAAISYNEDTQRCIVKGAK